MYCPDFSAFVIEMLLVKDQSSFYEIRSLAICTNIKTLIGFIETAEYSENISATSGILYCFLLKMI